MKLSSQLLTSSCHENTIVWINIRSAIFQIPETYIFPHASLTKSLKWIVVNRLENWRKSEIKNAQVSRKQKNKKNKNLKTYHYRYLMRTGWSLSYRYVILKYVWNELSSTAWKINVRVNWKTPKSAINNKIRITRF